MPRKIKGGRLFKCFGFRRGVIRGGVLKKGTFIGKNVLRYFFLIIFVRTDPLPDFNIYFILF